MTSAIFSTSSSVIHFSGIKAIKTIGWVGALLGKEIIIGKIAGQRHLCANA